MVKRATFLQMFLAAALLVIICAGGLALAKDKLFLKYLPVDHDIETISQENNTTANPVPLILRQTDSSLTVKTVKDHIGCLSCRELDQSCPDCCLINNASIHCQNMSDPDCSYPGVWPFDTASVNCTKTFSRTCGCSGKCAKYPENITTHCSQNGCPATTKPLNGTCSASLTDPNVWYCNKDNLKPRTAYVSRNERVKSCNYTLAGAYGTPTAALAAECSAANVTSPCYRYAATSNFTNCVANCTDAADKWEHDYYVYNNGTLGKAVCPAGNCTSGFAQNCNAEKCDKKLKAGCGNYTAAACVKMENDYREMLLGTITDTFDEIDPNFKYKFVARSGERYMISWQILCDVNQGDQKYNLYTMAKVWDQTEKKLVYQSIVHQKALGSTFYINAQTGMDDKKAEIIPGNAYAVTLHYFLPNDGETPLKVEIRRMQMILYRVKN